MKSNFKIYTAAVIAIMTIGSITIVSCDKESDFYPQEPTSLIKAAPGGIGDNDTIYVPGNTTKYWSKKKLECLDGGHGCLDPVIIDEKLYLRLKDIANAIRQNPSSAPSIFKNEQSDLSKVIDNNIISAVISEKVTVSIQLETWEKPFTYFIFNGQFQDSDTYVYPICK